MAKRTDSRHPYLKAAFLHQTNLVLLVGAGLFAAALASLTPLLLASLAEVAWLITAPLLPAFRAVVEREGETVAVFEPHTEPLGTKVSERRSRLEEQVAEVQRYYDERGGASRPDGRRAIDRLALPLQIHSDLWALSEQLRLAAETAPRSELVAEVAQLARALQTETQPLLRESLERSRALAERRLRHLLELETTHRAIAMRVDAIEKGFLYLQERVGALASLEQLDVEISRLVQESSIHAAHSATEEVDVTLRLGA